MGTVDLANALVQWVLAAGIEDQDQYEDMVWNKTKEVMAEFVDYMERDDITLYASNCDNKGWEHQNYPAGVRGVGQTVGDKIVCVLMVGALFFMNGWTSTESTRQREDDTSERIRAHLLCAIVHMFSQVLHESVCRSRWGIFYAWYSMEQMDTGPGSFPAGLIKKGTCGRNISSDVQIRDLELNAEVKKWLGQNSTLKKAITRVQGHALCTTRWQDAWSIDEILGNGTIQDTQGLPIAPIVHELKEGINELFTEIGKQAADSIEKREQVKKAQLEKDDKNGQERASNAATQAPAKPVAPTAKETPQGPTGKDRWGESTNTYEY
ncbi:hypothetical protein AK88_05425 [Plasmodium fragile]|uniref:Schizont-infected cell agglutination extracellular alpha domain-containing protein n=1 Tax=Plasmodium fragile TaxID=5857 RepID=A0A0D9QDM7_PLAFR|nr:uncharacterized protein AK88_05425 [Plasmodium fragile]KJP84947.1 hypothetical protein AK88_05425 [Plasmodium fragile]